MADLTGLWTIVTTVPGVENGSGCLTFADGKITGGNGEYYYVGQVDVDGDQFTGSLTITHFYGPIDPVFPGAKTELTLQGQVNGNTLNAIAKAGGTQVQVKGTKRT